MNGFINVRKSECTCADVVITSWSHVQVLMVFTCTHIILDFHMPVCLIYNNIQVSDYSILFVQAPVIYIFFLLIIQTPKQLRLLLQAEHFQMPTPHSRDLLHFKQREDEDLDVKHKLKEHFNASVCFCQLFLLCLHPKRLKKKNNSRENIFSRLLPFRPRNIQWSKINDTIPERAEFSGSTFQISRLSQSHNGTYLCQAQNDYGRAADHYTLLVYGE